MLAAALLMGAGHAVAVADPGSSGSAAHGDDGTNVSVQGSATASSPAGNGTHTPRKKVKDVTSTLGSGRQPGQQTSTGTKSPKNPKKAPGGTDSTDEMTDSGRQPGQQTSTGTKSPKNPKKAPGDTDSTDETTDSGLVAAVPNVVGPDPTTAAPAPTSVAPVSTVVAPESTVVTPVPTVVAPDPTVVAPHPTVVAPDLTVVAPHPTVVAPDLTVVAPDPAVVTPVPGAVVPFPTVVAPVSELIALVQDMLTSVAGAVVPLTQLQSDFYSFLLSISGLEPVGAALGGIDAAGLSAAADAWVASQWRLLSPAGILGGPLAVNATGFVPLGGIAASTFGSMAQVGRASWLPGMAPLAPNGATPMGVQSFLRHADGELLLPGSLSRLAAVALPVVLPLSLAALAAVALPGTGGLVILTAAGVRVGYRQAKAGVALRTAGIVRFAHPEGVPLAVVRSGSLVVVRPRTLRVVRAGAFRAGCLFDNVA